MFPVPPGALALFVFAKHYPSSLQRSHHFTSSLVKSHLLICKGFLTLLRQLETRFHVLSCHFLPTQLIFVIYPTRSQGMV